MSREAGWGRSARGVQTRHLGATRVDTQFASARQRVRSPYAVHCLGGCGMVLTYGDSICTTCAEAQGGVR